MTILNDLSCPSCNGSDFEQRDDGTLRCKYCESLFEIVRDDVICGVCGIANPPQAKRCMSCGTSLAAQCPVCTHINPPGLDQCEKCQSPLDTFSGITARIRFLREGASGERVRRLVDAKQTDMTYMAHVRQQLDTEERKRLTQLADQRAKAKQEQQQLFIIGLIILSMIIVATALLVILLN